MATARTTVYETSTRRIRINGDRAQIAQASTQITPRDIITGDNMRMANQPAKPDEVRQEEPSINKK